MKKALKITTLVVGIFLVITVAGFLIWTSDYYHADADALAILETHPDLVGAASGRPTAIAIKTKANG